MKLSAIITTFLLTGLLLLPSCETYEWTKAKRIMLESQGIELLPSDTGFLYRGDLPADETRFSIIPEDAHAKDALVSIIEIDGI